MYAIELLSKFHYRVTQCLALYARKRYLPRGTGSIFPKTIQWSPKFRGPQIFYYYYYNGRILFNGDENNGRYRYEIENYYCRITLRTTIVQVGGPAMTKKKKKYKT